MNRAELRTQIQTMLGDPAGVFLPDATANTVLDEALEVLAEHGPPVIRTALVPLAAYTTFYRLTDYQADAMQPVRVWSQSLQSPLEAVTQEELDGRAVAWIATTGPPTSWFVRGWDQFGVYPKPATDGGLLHVDCLCWPQALLDDASEPEFGDDEQEALVTYGWYDGSLRANMGEDVAAAWRRLQQWFADARTRRNALTADRAFRFQRGRNGDR